MLRALSLSALFLLAVVSALAAGVTGKWTLSMARKVASPDGEFLGIVEVALALDHFEALYRSVAPSAESSGLVSTGERNL